MVERAPPTSPTAVVVVAVVAVSQVVMVTWVLRSVLQEGAEVSLVPLPGQVFMNAAYFNLRGTVLGPYSWPPKPRLT